MLMDTQQKQLYEAPSALVIELIGEGVICDSPTQAKRFDYEYEEW